MTSSYLETLFYKHYAGNCTPEEETELMALVRDPANQDALQLLFERVWEHPATGVPFPEQSAEAIFSAILQTGKEADTKISKPLRRHFIWLAAAASIILIVAVGLFLIRTHFPTQRDMVTNIDKQTDAAPGGNKAILTLADGSHITLDSAANGQLTRQGNTNVIKTDSGQLAYHIAYESNQINALYNTISTPRGGQYKVILPDGSKVWLNAASSLRFPTAFASNERKVQLTGEGYFEIVKNSRSPFRVQVDSMQVEVLGTDFNIMAYREEEQVRTTLVEGAVNILKGNATALLMPGQQARLNKSGTLKVSDHPDMEEELAWKQGDFRFKKSGIDGIMRSLARWYDVEVEYKVKPSDLFNVDIPRNAKLSEVLKLLELTNSIHFQIEGKKIIVRP